MSDLAWVRARFASLAASTSGLDERMAAESVCPSLSTRCLRSRNGTCVFRAACATVANCSASRNPSAAIVMFAPLLRTGFSRACSAGVDGGIVTALAVLFVVLARGAAARGALAGAAAGGKISAAGAVIDASRV